jgi:hypothetical protein
MKTITWELMEIEFLIRKMNLKLMKFKINFQAETFEGIENNFNTVRCAALFLNFFFLFFPFQ